MKRIFLLGTMLILLAQMALADSVFYSYAEEKSAYSPGFICSYTFEEATPCAMRMEFKARKQFGSVCYTPDMYLRVAIANNAGGWDWQDDYIWDSSEAGMSSNYKTFSVTLPAGTHKIEFRTNAGATLQRFVKDLVVYNCAKCEPSVDELDFGEVMIGDKKEMSFTLSYTNAAALAALVNDAQFAVEFEDQTMGMAGSQTVKVTYAPTSFSDVESSLLLSNGVKAAIALKGSAVKIATPLNFRIEESADKYLYLKWDEVEDAVYYLLRNLVTNVEYTMIEPEYALYADDARLEDDYEVSAVYNDLNISFPRLLSNGNVNYPTGLSEAAAKSVMVYVQGGMLTVDGMNEGDSYCIVDVRGNVYAKGSAFASKMEFDLPCRGVLVVVVEGKAFKVMM